MLSIQSPAPWTENVLLSVRTSVLTEVKSPEAVGTYECDELNIMHKKKEEISALWNKLQNITKQRTRTHITMCIHITAVLLIRTPDVDSVPVQRSDNYVTWMRTFVCSHNHCYNLNMLHIHIRGDSMHKKTQQLSTVLLKIHLSLSSDIQTVDRVIWAVVTIEMMNYLKPHCLHCC